MDPEITAELRGVVQSGLYAIERDALGSVPVDTGDLAQSITVRISRDGLTGVVGPGIRTAEPVRSRTGSAFSLTIKRGRQAGEKIRLSDLKKDDLMQFYKGYWIEFGTKGGSRNQPPQPARPFMGPAYDANRIWLKRAVSAAIDRALKKAAK